MTRRNMGAALIGGAATAAMVGAKANAAARSQLAPPPIAAPAGAERVTVTLRLTAKDGEAFARHVLKVIPVTRIASGCRYSHTYRDQQRPNEFLLVQGWDSIEQQRGYIGWREKTGDLATFLGFLNGPPTIEVFSMFDA